MRKIAVAALIASAVGLGAPASQAADPVSVDCGFNAIAQETVTGGQDTFTGIAYGYVAADVSAEGTVSVTIRCTVRVNGTTVAATATASATVFATVQGQVTYTASDTDDVDLCAEWTVGSSSGEVCSETTTTQTPPQEVIDALRYVRELIPGSPSVFDPIICGALLAAGVPAIVNLGAPTVSMDADDCDIYVLGDRFINFVPYDD